MMHASVLGTISEVILYRCSAQQWCWISRQVYLLKMYHEWLMPTLFNRLSEKKTNWWPILKRDGQCNNAFVILRSDGEGRKEKRGKDRRFASRNVSIEISRIFWATNSLRFSQTPILWDILLIMQARITTPADILALYHCISGMIWNNRKIRGEKFKFLHAGKGL